MKKNLIKLCIDKRVSNKYTKYTKMLSNEPFKLILGDRSDNELSTIKRQRIHAYIAQKVILSISDTNCLRIKLKKIQIY